MGTIKVHEFTTLDGVVDAPTWTSGFSFVPGMEQAIGEVMGGCRAILLGRTTYEMFEPAWSVRSAEDDPGAPFMNDSTKYVVSSTLRNATWRNTELVGGYDPNTIRRIKDEVDGGIYVSGSSTLVRALIGDGLVDELHLFVFPITRASEPHLFPDVATTWSLTTHDAYDNGVLYLAYARAEAA